MIFATSYWLSISINLLLVVFVVVCLLMALLILMQRPKQEGLGAAFGGGVTDQVFGARTTNVLQKTTVYLASMFFLLSITLAILIGKQNEQKSLIDKNQEVVEAAEPVDSEPEGEVVVVEPPKPSLAGEITPVEEQKPANEAAPVNEGTAPVEGVAPSEVAPVEESTPAEEATPAEGATPVEGSAAEEAPAEGSSGGDKNE